MRIKEYVLTRIKNRRKKVREQDRKEWEIILATEDSYRAHLVSIRKAPFYCSILLAFGMLLFFGMSVVVDSYYLLFAVVCMAALSPFIVSYVSISHRLDFHFGESYAKSINEYRELYDA